MKKRIYRAVDVKALNLDELRKVVKNQKIVLGVDVAKEDFVAALMNEKREVLSTIKWKHPMETGMLLDVMLHKLPWFSLDVAMEPSGTYGDTLRALFLGNGIKVYRVSPKRCHDAAEVYDGVPSLHDPKAATIIGLLHLDGASEEWPLPEKAQRELRAAIKTMELYDDAYYRNINRLESLLARHWPEVTQHLKLTSVTLLELIMAFGGPDRVAAEPEKEGIETIMELKRDFPDVKIIAISGGDRIGPEDYLQLAKKLGAMHTFTKPIDRKELLGVVRKLLK